MGLADLVRDLQGPPWNRRTVEYPTTEYPPVPEDNDEPVWKMRDGTEVLISDLGDRHLVNCLRMLHRVSDGKLEAMRWSELDAGFAFLSTLGGDMAQMCAEQALHELSMAERPQLIRILTPWNHLEEEAERRGLDFPQLDDEEDFDAHP